jgi:hypothetical protein
MSETLARTGAAAQPHLYRVKKINHEDSKTPRNAKLPGASSLGSGINQSQPLENTEVVQVARDKFANIITKKRGNKKSVRNALAPQVVLLEERKRLQHGRFIGYDALNVPASEIESRYGDGFGHRYRRVEAPAIRNDVDKLVKDRRRQHQSRARILELIQKERSDRHMFRHGWRVSIDQDVRVESTPQEFSFTVSVKTSS